MPNEFQTNIANLQPGPSNTATGGISASGPGSQYLPINSDLTALDNAAQGGAAPQKPGGIRGVIETLIGKKGLDAVSKALDAKNLPSGNMIGGSATQAQAIVDRMKRNNADAASKKGEGVDAVSSASPVVEPPTIPAPSTDIPNTNTATSAAAPTTAAQDSSSSTTAKAPSDWSMQGAETPKVSGGDNLLTALQQINDMYSGSKDYNPTLLDRIANGLQTMSYTYNGISKPTLLEQKMQRHQQMRTEGLKAQQNLVQKALDFKYQQGLSTLNAQLQAGVITPAQYEMQSKLKSQDYWNETNRWMGIIRSIMNGSGMSKQDAAQFLQSHIPGGNASLSSAGNMPSSQQSAPSASGVAPISGNLGQ